MSKLVINALILIYSQTLSRETEMMGKEILVLWVTWPAVYKARAQHWAKELLEEGREQQRQSRAS